MGGQPEGVSHNFAEFAEVNPPVWSFSGIAHTHEMRQGCNLHCHQSGKIANWTMLPFFVNCIN